MKKVIIIAGITSLFIGACSNLKHTTYNDDIYVDPKEEKLEKERIAAALKKKQEEEEKKRQEELAAQKAKDDANPAYKDPVYSKDDYYDYQYASRIRRFDNPVYGLGYYDNYYTNYYWYNNNPAYYGTSIYSSYNYWGPSYGFGPSYGCTFGMSYNWGNPYYGYNPYNYGYYDPYYNNAYWNGYYNGYHNGLYGGYYGYPYYGYNPYSYGGWGYYNSYDANSGYYKSTYAPRTSHGGGNSGRLANPGLNNNADGYRTKYISSVLNQNEATPKFNETSRPVRVNKTLDNKGGEGAITPSSTNPTSSEPRPNPYYNNPVRNNPKDGINNNGATDIQMNNPQPIKTNPIKQPTESAPVKPIRTENPKGNLFESGSPNFNGGNNSAPSGGSSPRGNSSGGGSTTRPR